MKRHKFGAQKTIAKDGTSFPSKLECKRYEELLLLQRAGEIHSLERQPVLKLSINGAPILIRSKGYPNGRQAKYTPDFAYFDNRRNKRVYCEVKGFRTSDYALRRAVTEACYPGIIIDEITK